MASAWTETERALFYALEGTPYYYGGGPGRRYAAGSLAGQEWDGLHGPWAAQLVGGGIASIGNGGGLDCSGCAALVVRLLCRVRGVSPPRWTFEAPSVRGLMDALPAVDLPATRAGDLYVYNGGQHVTFALGNGYVLGANGGGPGVLGDKPYECVEIRRYYWSSALTGALRWGS